MLNYGNKYARPHTGHTRHLMILGVQFHTLHTVSVSITVQLELETGHGTVGSYQRCLLLHVVLTRVVESFEVLSQSFIVLALLKETVAFFLELIEEMLRVGACACRKGNKKNGG